MAIEDLGTRHGTSAGDRPVQRGPVPLHDGDQLRFGLVVVTSCEAVEGRPNVTLAE